MEVILRCIGNMNGAPSLCWLLCSMRDKKKRKEERVKELPQERKVALGEWPDFVAILLHNEVGEEFLTGSFDHSIGGGGIGGFEA